VKALFRQLTIKVKLILIISIAVFAVIISQAISLNELWLNLNDNKRNELKNITEVAYSILAKQNSLVKQEKITIEQAKSTIKSEISALRYGNN